MAAPFTPLRLAAIAALALPFASPAMAQQDLDLGGPQGGGSERVNMVIAYSEDECPEQSQEGEIVVCEILVEADRYRIPSNLRQSGSPENQSWSRQVDSIRYIGEFGTMSCDPAGAGGFTGCTQQLINAAFADRAEGENVRFAQLIDEARQERLSTIDEDAAAEQARVEQIEQEYLDRLERERDAPLPGEDDLAPLAPEAVVGPVDEGPGQ